MEWGGERGGQSCYYPDGWQQDSDGQFHRHSWGRSPSWIDCSVYCYDQPCGAASDGGWGFLHGAQHLQLGSGLYSYSFSSFAAERGYRDAVCFLFLERWGSPESHDDGPLCEYGVHGQLYDPV